MPQALSTQEVGLLRLLQSLCVLLAQFASLGFGNASLRYFPYFRNQAQHHHGYLFLSLAVATGGFLICGLSYPLYRPFLDQFLNVSQSSILQENLYVALTMAFCVLFFAVFDNYARALYETVAGTFLKEFMLRVFIGTAVVVYFYNWVSFSQFMQLWQLAYLLPTLLMVFYVWKSGQFFLKPQLTFLTPDLTKGIARLSLLTLLSGFTTQIVLYLDQLMVSGQSGLSQNGVYATVMMFGTVIGMPAQQMYRITGPVIADKWKTQEEAGIVEIYQKSCLTLLIIGSLLFVGIMVNLHNILWLLPPAYAAGGSVVFYIGLGKLFDMATGVNGLILTTSRYYYYDTVFFVALVFLIYWLNHELIPRYGIEGSAIATCISLFLFNLSRTFFVWIKFNMQPFTRKNGYVLVITLTTWGIISQIPRWQLANATVQFLLDTAMRGGLTLLLLGGSVYGLRLSADINTTIDQLIKKIRP